MHRCSPVDNGGEGGGHPSGEKAVRVHIASKREAGEEGNGIWRMAKCPGKEGRE